MSARTSPGRDKSWAPLPAATCDGKFAWVEGTAFADFHCVESYFSTKSQQVQSFFDTLDWESDHDVLPEEREEATKTRRMVEAIVDDIIASREMVTDNRFASLERRLVDTPEVIESFLDERFTRDVVNALRLLLPVCATSLHIRPPAALKHALTRLQQDDGNQLSYLNTVPYRQA